MNLIESALRRVTVGEPVSYLNLQVFPLLVADEPPPPYVTLDEALELKGFTITEVSEQGSVPNLKATNTLDRPVLLVDGEELVGAKQNRVLNLTVLVPAGAEVVIPVSCVEAGRWRHSSSSFASAERAQYGEGRALRVRQVSGSLSRREGARSDQGEIWSNIASKQQRLGVNSPTRAMSDMYEQLGGRIEAYTAAFTAQPHQAGAVFVRNGELQGMDLTDSPATFRKLFGKLVRSHALDAVDSGESAAATEPAAPQEFLESVRAAAASEFPAIGLGRDVRLQGPGVAGAGLAWEGRLVHLCAFAGK